MRFKTLFGLIALVSLGAPALAAPGDMSAATFLAKVDGLKAKGPMALFSGDIGKLKAEGAAAGNYYRARLQADRAAGRPPHSCPPKGSTVTSDQLIAHLRAYPAATRARTSMKIAIADYFAKTYPCT
jgi:hypothetical protein